MIQLIVIESGKHLPPLRCAIVRYRKEPVMSHSGTQQPAWSAGKSATDQIVIGFSFAFDWTRRC